MTCSEPYTNSTNNWAASRWFGKPPALIMLKLCMQWVPTGKLLWGAQFAGLHHNLLNCMQVLRMCVWLAVFERDQRLMTFASPSCCSDAMCSPKMTAKIDPACNMGPSLPITKLLPTARALPITLATNVFTVKKFLNAGFSTPFR